MHLKLVVPLSPKTPNVGQFFVDKIKTYYFSQYVCKYYAILAHLNHHRTLS